MAGGSSCGLSERQLERLFLKIRELRDLAARHKVTISQFAV
jgi:hypothetical protein